MMDPQQPPEDSAGATRAPRAPVYLMAKLESAAGEIDVKLRNISAYGALVQAPTVPSRGNEVILRRNGIVTHGIVVWSDRSFAGIRFNRPLKPDRLLRTINRPAPVEVDPEEYRRPGFHVRALSEAEREWALRFTSAPLTDCPGD